MASKLKQRPMTPFWAGDHPKRNEGAPKIVKMSASIFRLNYIPRNWANSEAVGGLSQVFGAKIHAWGRQV
jgi:hypothetical protein